MKTFSTKRIKKLQENTKTVDINEVIHLKNYIFLVSIMFFIGNHVLEERVEGVHIKDRDSIRRRKYAR
jgi:hypothetical protein